MNFLLIGIGVLTGICFQMHWFSGSHSGWNPFEQSLYEFAVGGGWAKTQMNLRLALTPVISILVLFLLRAGMRKLLSKFLWYGKIKTEHQKYDTLIFLPLLLMLTEAWGFYITPSLLFLSIPILQAYLISKLLKRQNIPLGSSFQFQKEGRLGVFFLISGCAALIYQIVWQRLLSMAYGVNIESISIIVSAFILGLGTGALIGGLLSRRFPSRLPLLFLICELGIGIFGLFSYTIIGYTVGLSQHIDGLALSLTLYMLLIIPTIFMGATLPILVEHLHLREKTVGYSVANLYFLNTIGSAIASFVTVNILLVYFTLTIACYFAVSLNFLVGFLIYRLALKQNKQNKEQASAIISSSSKRTSTESASLKAKLLFAVLLSAVTGFISLSQEIIWVRVIGYFTGSKSVVFGNVLGFFLLGVAFGSLYARRLIHKYKEKLTFVMGVILLISGLSFYIMLPVGGYLSMILGEGALAFLMIFVAIHSFLIGILFPLLSQYALSQRETPGFYVSCLYFANIIGSAAGPLVTGLVLFDLIALEYILLAFSIFISLLAAFLLAPTLIRRQQKRYIFVYSISILVLFSCHEFFFYDFWEKFYFKHKYLQNGSFKRTIENKSGIINTIKRGGGDDTIIGSGMYDSTFNTDPFRNSNAIVRAYMMAALHPNPEKILVIGLSGGSWATVVASHQAVKNIDIIEINPGYVELIPDYPSSSSLLSDSRVKIYTDDGRRWLRRNPQKKYDFILMNTTFHWRAQINNLVSYEFLQLAKKHLKKDGVMYYNTTGSHDIPYTAAHVFDYVTNFNSFIAVSDSPFSQTLGQKKDNLLKFLNQEKKPILANSGLLGHLAGSELKNQRKSWLEKKENLYLINDNNLASEFKSTSRYYVPQKNWFLFLWNYIR